MMLDGLLKCCRTYRSHALPILFVLVKDGASLFLRPWQPLANGKKRGMVYAP